VELKAGSRWRDLAKGKKNIIVRQCRRREHVEDFQRKKFPRGGGGGGEMGKNMGWGQRKEEGV